METEKYDWTPESGQAYDEDEDGSPYQPLDCVEDAELLRKRRELELIEKQIASKKAAIASKKTVPQRPLYGEEVGLPCHHHISSIHTQLHFLP